MDLSFLQPLSYLIAIGVFVWYLRKDSKDDYIRLETQSRTDVLRLDAKLEFWRSESNQILKAIQEEMKDFHGRLCALEEKNKKNI